MPAPLPSDGGDEVKSTRTGVAAVALTGLLITLAPNALAAPGDERAEGNNGKGPDWAEEVTDSKRLGEPVSAQGRVSARGGQDPAAGATVYLQAWPSEEDLAEMEVGDPLELTPIARTVTDERGRFSLRIDPDVDIEGLWSEQGSMDVDLVAVHEGDVTSHAFSLTPDDDSSDDDQDPFVAHVDRPNGKVTKLISLDLELGSPAATELGPPADDAENVEEAEDGTDGLEDAEAGGSADDDLSPQGHYNGSCPGGEGLKENYGDKWVNVGSIHTATSGKSMKFTYTGSASSSLGVGVSASGDYGSFEASGTVERSRSNTTTFPEYSTSTSLHLDTAFSYGKYCVQYYDSMHGTGHRYEARATRHEGGTNSRSTSIPSTDASNCVAYNVSGSGGEKTTTNAITWTNGAKLGSSIGIDLSSRTGYRTDAKIEYAFDTPGRLCGTHDKPNGAPRRLVMRAQ